MIRAINRVRVALTLAAAASTLVFGGTAVAQVSSGKMEGKVTDASTNAPLADVVVTATSPSLQGEQTVVTDPTGEFEFPVLPAGKYLVHLEKEGYKPLNQPDLDVHIDKTIRVALPLIPESIQSAEVVVVGHPPTVDVGSTQTGATITDDFLNNIPVDNPNAGFGARSFESLAGTAPGTTNDGSGISIAGSSSPENNYTIDGVNVTDPTYGLLGSSLSIDFIKEVDVITGGYMPEYGRATGGIENVITKSGGNEFHGSFRLDVMPGTQLTPKVPIPFGSTLSATGQTNLLADMGAEVGGYIIKDKLWFYAGVEPNVSEVTLIRSLNSVSYVQGCPVDATGANVASSGDPNFHEFSSTNQNCSPSVMGNSVDATGSPAVAATTPIAGSSSDYHEVGFGAQYLGKLTYLLNQDQTFTLSAFGNPATADGPVGVGAAFSGVDLHRVSNVGDYSLKWNGAFLDKHVLAEATVGLHHQDNTTTPEDPTELNDPGVLWSNTHSITEFEPATSQFCGANDAANAGGPGVNPGAGFFRCPVTGYGSGGPGYIDDGSINNYQGRLALTNLFRAAGHHEVKYGIDYNYIDWTHTKEYTGGGFLQENAGTPGIFYDSRLFGYLTGPNPAVNQPVFLGTFTSKSITTDLAGFVQDSWRILDLVTLNFGVRWEDQQLYQSNGADVMNLPNEWMPRVGLIYDWTGQGRSKVFANYARFYEDIPLDLIDRGYPAERQIGVFRDTAPFTPCDPRNPTSREGICTQNASAEGAWFNTGSPVEPIDPNLQGQNTDEISAGSEYEIFEDARVGLTYTHRNYNAVMEDMSLDHANSYFISNPGFGLASTLPTAQRDYDALSIYFNKNFSHHWMVNANYTLSRLYGNYGGLILYSNGQLDPNITGAFDEPQFIQNQTGPLSNDHTHNIKVYAARDFPINAVSSVTVGGTYEGLSGAPLNYFGADFLYGPGTVNILPQGSGGRLPWTHEFDASFKYNYKLSDSNTLTGSVDIFNIFNLQGVTSEDQNYTFDNVVPIYGGSKADLANLKSVSPIGPVSVNPDFGRPTSFQAPLTVRFGLKLTF